MSKKLESFFLENKIIKIGDYFYNFTFRFRSVAYVNDKNEFIGMDQSLLELKYEKIPEE